MAQASLLAEFRDFDKEDEFEQLKGAVVDAKTRNFAIEFDSAKAYAAQDLAVESMERLLSIEVSGFGLIEFFASESIFVAYLYTDPRLTTEPIQRPKHSSARWMYVQTSLVNHGSADFTLSNIWAPDQQQELVKVCFDSCPMWYFSHTVSRHCQTITTSHPDYVVSCAPTMVRLTPRFLTYPRPTAAASACVA